MWCCGWARGSTCRRGAPHYHGGRWIVASSRSVKLLTYLVPPEMRPARATAWAGRFAAREGLTAVEVLHERCAGMDISKKDVKVCIRVPGGRGGRYRNEVTTFGSMTGQILELRAFLLEQQVTLVVMESTGDYWKPFYYVLENAAFELLLVNPRHCL